MKKEQEENAFKAKYPKSQKFMEIMGAIVGKVLSLVPIVGPLLELKKRVAQGFRRFADWSVFSRAEDESSNGKGGVWELCRKICYLLRLQFCLGLTRDGTAPFNLQVPSQPRELVYIHWVRMTTDMHVR